MSEQQPKPNRNRNRRPKKPQSSNETQDQSKSRLKGGNESNKPSPKFLEINKLIKKYHPTQINGTSITSLSMPLPQLLKNLVNQDIYLVFEIRPSDPDFPFELSILKFSLFVPLNYPFYQNKDKVTRPSIVVLNNDIPRGYSVNIEIGFNEIIDKCVEQKTSKKKRNRNRKKKKEEDDDDEEEDVEIELVQGTDLSSIILTLDKFLERFLSREKKDTIKIVRYKKQQSSSPAPPSPSPLPQQAPVIKKQEIQVPREISEIRSREIHKLLQRLDKQFQIRKFKSTQFNDIYSLNVPLTNELDPRGLIIETDGDSVVGTTKKNLPLQIAKLPCRLHIPTDYLFNEKKSIKLEIDKNFMIKMVSEYDEPLKKLEISTKINTMINNFNSIVSMKFLLENMSNLNDLKHSLTSQLNFFVHNSNKMISDSFSYSCV